MKKETRICLERMGWHESRRVNVEADVNCLVGDGYSCFKAGIEFLEKYSGLSGFSPSFSNPDVLERIHFVVPLAISRTYREVVGEYERRIGGRLVLVGEMHNEHMILMVSDRGQLYGAYDGYLCCYGGASDDGLDAAILNLPITEIP